MKIHIDVDIDSQEVDSAQFTVTARIELDSGEFVTLLDDRGWGVYAPHREGVDFREYLPLTISDIKTDSLNALLPDDAEETGRSQDWPLYVSILRRHGVATSEAELAAVTQVVRVSDKILQLTRISRD